ncbi:uncharacterized membrane protein YhaH (DUF805 family) [Staphylococcus saprophyticus]|uniref:DUF805 domain-containing protein n=1 Tax=Staphylococcus saprophyticus TaxID=29385 RepID=UPI00085A5EA6|nr:DUF805 domain-containing protein [Staphylococcus saprophyticus]MBN6851130.1 DUF805 domain-containing protein [Staphylococcus saprophyticus]MBU8680949.1 DUF805 domain-containing protein [Staphylococcus saprophyticus]MCT1652126.1 DUF805 domain-containing protein [Staphylococcus saprophyticus]MDW3802467.1 DUF805 domain-containing protein [Staphylococcus saprophyticus]MDW3839234.1 DUF805 domain-containing protein [Staphylococcus saprophyticus]
MIHYYKLFWINALNIKGRSRRKEFWYPFLMNILINIMLEIIFFLLPIPAIIEDTVGWIVYILILVAMFTVTVRRFHDVGMTMLIPIIIFLIAVINDFSEFINSDIPTLDNSALTVIAVIFGVVYIVILIVSLAVCCTSGQKETNQYGVNPKAVE